MNLYQCQMWAENNGFDRAEFYADFPAGQQKCRWLDAYFGIFEIPGVTDGFLSVSQIDQKFPDLVCTPIELEKTE